MSGHEPSYPPPLALTMGDPSGIGLDIALKAWHARHTHMLSPFCLYADASALATRAEALDLATPVIEIENPREATRCFDTALPLRVIATAAPVVAGMPTSENAPAIVTAIETAVSDIAAGNASALVTNPIAKSLLYTAGFAHPGHTEFLATLAQKHWPEHPNRPVMMLSGKNLRVVPLTIHIPLAEVPHRLTQDLIVDTIRIAVAALRRDFAIETPRIAVAGLNPHAGEDGALGREEIDIIAPAIATLRAEGLTLAGPLSADTMFHDDARTRYDLAICMYHDQALIPIKTLAFDEGVNTTLGLPFIRTSPDHGTAFAIAGTGKASPLSLIAALKAAWTMVDTRLQAVS